MRSRWLIVERVASRGELVRSHGLWAGLMLAALVAARLLPMEGMPGMRCPALMLTSFPCPTCGLTRGFVAAGHGAFAEAWAQAPLAPILYVGAALLFIVHATALAARVRVAPGGLFAWNTRTRWMVAALLVAALAVNWIYRLEAGLR